MGADGSRGRDRVRVAVGMLLAVGVAGGVGWAMLAKNTRRGLTTEEGGGRLDVDAWRALCAASGAPLPCGDANLAKLRRIVKRGGVVDAVRPLCWPILFGLDAEGDAGADLPGTSMPASAPGGQWGRRRALQVGRRERYKKLLHKVGDAMREVRPVGEDLLQGGFTAALRDAARVLDIDLQRLSGDPEDADVVAMRPMLRRIVLAHVALDPEVGYCQGMAEVAAPFLGVLLQFGHTDTMGHSDGGPEDGVVGGVTLAESEAFWLFEAVLRRHLGDNFRDGFRGVWSQLRCVRQLCTRHDPALARAIVASGIAQWPTLEEAKDDSAGMKAGEVAARLYAEPFLFCFRAILLGFRRELSRDAFLALLEIRAADAQPARAALLACHFLAAMLIQDRGKLLAHDGTDVGRDEACYSFFHDAGSCKSIAFWPTLARARAMLARSRPSELSLS